MTHQSPELTYTIQDIRQPTHEQSALLDAQLDALASLALSPTALEAGLYGPLSVDRTTIKDDGHNKRLVSWIYPAQYESYCVYMGGTETGKERFFLTAAETEKHFIVEGIASRMGRDRTYFMHASVNKAENNQCKIGEVVLDFPGALRRHHTARQEGAPHHEQKQLRVGITQNQVAEQVLRIGSFAAQTALQRYESPFRPAVTPAYRMLGSLLGLMLSRVDQPDHAEWMRGLSGPDSPVRNGVIFEDNDTFVALHQPLATHPVRALTRMERTEEFGPHGTQYRVGPDFTTMKFDFLRYPLTRESASRNLGHGHFSGETTLIPPQSVLEQQLEKMLTQLVKSRVTGLDH